MTLVEHITHQIRLTFSPTYAAWYREKQRAYLASLISLRDRVDTILKFQAMPWPEAAAWHAYEQAVASLRGHALEGDRVARQYLLYLAHVTEDRLLAYTVADVLSQQPKRETVSHVIVACYLRAAQAPLRPTPLHHEARLKAQMMLSLLYASEPLRRILERLAAPLLGERITLPALALPRDDALATRYAFAAIAESDVLTQHLLRLDLGRERLPDATAYQLGDFFESHALIQPPSVAARFFAQAAHYFEQVSPRWYRFEEARYHAAHLLHYVLELPQRARAVLAPLLRRGDPEARQVQAMWQHPTPSASVQGLEAEEEALTPATLALPPTQVPDEAQEALYRAQADAEDNHQISFNQPPDRRITMPRKLYLDITQTLTQEAFHARTRQLAVESPFRLQVRQIVEEARAALRLKDQSLALVKRRDLELRVLESLAYARLEIPTTLLPADLIQQAGAGAEAQAEIAAEAEAETKQTVAAVRLKGLQTVTLPDDDTELFRQLERIVHAHQDISFWERRRVNINFIRRARRLLEAVNTHQVIAHLYSGDVATSLQKLLVAELVKKEHENSGLKTGTTFRANEARIQQLEATNTKLTARITELETQLSAREHDVKALHQQLEQVKHELEQVKHERERDKELARQEREQNQKRLQAKIEDVQTEREKDKGDFLRRLEQLEQRFTGEITTLRTQLREQSQCIEEAGGIEALRALKEEPEAYLCPISTELMTDPVVTVDGYTYQRASIERWFKQQYPKLISPLTNRELSSATLTPNYNLKKQVDDYLRCQRQAQPVVPASTGLSLVPPSMARRVTGSPIFTQPASLPAAVEPVAPAGSDCCMM